MSIVADRRIFLSRQTSFSVWWLLPLAVLLGLAMLIRIFHVEVMVSSGVVVLFDLRNHTFHLCSLQGCYSISPESDRELLHELVPKSAVIGALMGTGAVRREGGLTPSRRKPDQNPAAQRARTHWLCTAAIV
jgi:hypothetical protein